MNKQAKAFAALGSCHEMETPEQKVKLLSNLEEWVLLIVGDSTVYGWKILKDLNEAFKGQRTFSYGSLYPTLHRLEQIGLLASAWGDDQEDSHNGARKRYYNLTDQGKEALNQMEEYRCVLRMKQGQVISA